MKTVLIIDDEPLVQRMLARTCARAKALWHIAGHGKEAFEYLKTNPLPSLIICDYNMPVMTGPEFIMRRGAIKDLVAVPLLLHSSEPDAEQVARKFGLLFHKKGQSITPLMEEIRRYTSED